MFSKIPLQGGDAVNTRRERTVLHCDLNSFFASAELLDRPELREKAVAVGGDEQARHGIILAKNELAKKFGVKTGETLWEARSKCPELIVLPPNFDKYMYWSKRVRDIYCRYTDLVESFGADECWLDVTGSRLIFGDGMAIAESIRQTVKRETGLTVSIGVSFNKIMAKLGSDMKKPDAITEIRRDELSSKIWKLDCGDLFGVGRATAAKLKKYGVFTIGDLANTSDDFVKNVFGKCGLQIRDYARGNDESPVTHEDYTPEIKSISHGCTSAFDLYDIRAASLLVISLSESIAEKLRRYGFCAHNIKVFIRLNTLASVSFSKSVNAPLISARQIYTEACLLIEENCDFSVPVRAISVAVSALSSEKCYQTDLFFDSEKIERIARAESAADKIRKRMGDGAIVRASLMNVNFTRNCAIYEFNPFGHNAIR